MSPRLMEFIMDPRVQALAADPKKLLATVVGVPLAVLVVIGLVLGLTVGLLWGIVIPIMIAVALVVGAVIAIRRMQAEMAAQMEQMQQAFGGMDMAAMFGQGPFVGGPGSFDPDASPFGPGSALFGSGSAFFGPGASPFGASDEGVPPSTNSEQLARLLAQFDPVESADTGDKLDDDSHGAH